jgi:hypothetical protein
MYTGAMSMLSITGRNSIGAPAKRYRGRLVAVLVLLAAAVPSTLLGEPSGSSSSGSFESFPLVKAVNLQANIQLGGASVKMPVVVAAGKEFTIRWKSVGHGCISNWDEELLPASGSAVGTVSKSRAFVITCYGRGAAQTATLPVTVGAADLSIGTFSVVGLKPAKGKKNAYLTGSEGEDEHAPFVLKASVKNLGKLPVGKSFLVEYQESEDGKSGWVSIAEQTVDGMDSGSTLALDELPRIGNPNGDTSYYRVCADTEEKIEETKESNNCSKVLGPYSFVQAE